MKTGRSIERAGAVALGGLFALLLAACSSVAPVQQESARSEPAAGVGPEPLPAVPYAQVQQSSTAGEAGQAAQAGAAVDEDVIVTGTRIRRDDFSAPNATTVISAEDMRALGVISVTDMVNQLPNRVASVSPEADGEGEYDVGASVANLRGLNTFFGPRTLTVIENRQQVSSSNGTTQDMSMIPSGLVNRIETLPGGGLATYGADAMAGVGIGVDGIGQPVTVQFSDPLIRAEPGEEIWVIERDFPGSVVADDEPGTGVMLANVMPSDADADRPLIDVPLPLRHTDVHAKLVGYVGTVDVTQQFENPFDRKIEAVYLFPLPEKAAVSEFVMTIGERRIRGILREKEEAQQIYNQARAQGYNASLLTQHRPNIFEQKVANIEPGKKIDINIRYFQTLAYRDGWYSFVFPTVVGPRYNPPGSSDRVLALPRSDFSLVEQGTAVRYMRPNERSGHDIGITVDIDAGVDIEEVDSTHLVNRRRQGRESMTVSLSNQETIPNRDFVLRFRVAGGRVKSDLLTYEDPESGQGYFTMMLYPPRDLKDVSRQPMEMVFVIDTSGSMSGQPILQAREAVIEALDMLEPEDTFQVVRFSSNVSQLGARPLPATVENIERAKQYVAELSGSGGTQMIEGIRAALDFEHDPRRLRFVTFLTDGYIGNEQEIIGAINHKLGASRIFSFGVGTSVNRYLLERMASEGRGAAAFLGLTESGSEIMSFFFERISHPALANLEIDWGDMAVSDVYPSRLPDLFVGRPVVITGKYSGSVDEPVIAGVAGGESIAFRLDREGDVAAHEFLPKLWARLRIADLVDRQALMSDPHGELAGEIRATALSHGVMSDYTSFVAVDASERTAGDSATTVFQAVPVPRGVRYETSVPE